MVSGVGARMNPLGAGQEMALDLPMIRIIETDAGPFFWEGRWEYAIRSGEAVIGTLQIAKDISMSALGQSLDGQWRFKKSWFPS